MHKKTVILPKKNHRYYDDFQYYLLNELLTFVKYFVVFRSIGIVESIRHLVNL